MLKHLLLGLPVLLLAVQPACEGADTPIPGNLYPPSKIKAILVSGSKGWENYRHQAGVLNMYQMLHYGNVPDSNIVMMHYDDIARNPMNPFPGKVFAKKFGPDVYDGAWTDYRGESVTSQNFFAALTGEKEKIIAYNASECSRRVLETDADDTIIVYFAGYGAPGLLAMPNYPSDNIFGDDLNAAILRMAKGQAPNTFGRMLLLVDAPHAGSMFDSLMDMEAPAMAITATDRSHVNYGIHCDDNRFTLGSPCIADAFTYSLVEVMRTIDLPTATLDEMFGYMHDHHWALHTAHASTYGVKIIGSMRLSTFFGQRRATDIYLMREELPMLEVSKQTEKGVEETVDHQSRLELKHHQACAAYDTKLCFLRVRSKMMQAYNDAAAQKKKTPELTTWQGEEEQLTKVENVRLINNEFNHLLTWRDQFNSKFDQVLHEMVNRFMHFEEIKNGEIKSGVVKDWNCYKNMLRMMSNMCEWEGNPYLIERFSSLASLCSIGRTPSDLASAASHVCCQGCNRPPAPYRMPDRLHVPVEQDPEFIKLTKHLDLHEHLHWKEGERLSPVHIPKESEKKKWKKGKGRKLITEA